MCVCVCVSERERRGRERVWGGTEKRDNASYTGKCLLEIMKDWLQEKKMYTVNYLRSTIIYMLHGFSHLKLTLTP